MWKEGVAALDWEDGATVLPVLKKRLERPLTAVVDRVSIVFVVLSETTSADVLEGCTGLGFVAIFFVATLPAVVHDTNVIGFHVYFRDLVDVRVGGLLLFARVTGAAGAIATGVLVGFVGAVWTSGAFLVRVGLRVVVVSAPEVLQAFVDRFPGVCPLKSAHLPSHMNILIDFQHGLVIIGEGHIDKKLEKRQLISKLMVKTGAGSFGGDLGDHTIHKLVESEIHMSC